MLCVGSLSLRRLEVLMIGNLYIRISGKRSVPLWCARMKSRHKAGDLILPQTISKSDVQTFRLSFTYYLDQHDEIISKAHVTYCIYPAGIECNLLC
jgi:hypothetical protein